MTLSSVVGQIVGHADPAPSYEQREKIGLAVADAETWDDLPQDVRDLLTLMQTPPVGVRHQPGSHNQKTHGGGGGSTAVADKPRLTFADLANAKKREQNQVPAGMQPTGLQASRAADLPDPKLDDREHQSVRRYSGDAYLAINKAHNRGTELKGSYANDSNNLDSAISKNKIDRDVLVTRHASYSSIGGRGPDQKGVDPAKLKGTVVRNKAFTSTSLVEEPFDYEYRETQWNIHVPKGTNGIYIDRVGVGNGEKELLLGRDTNLAIRGVRPGGAGEGKWVIDAEVVGR